MTITFTATAIVVIAALNIFARIAVHKARVAKVDSAGIGNTPPQIPIATDSPICSADSVFAGVTNFSVTQFRIDTMVNVLIGRNKDPKRVV